ncbi:hypothetical protein Ancab_008103 [Ancistrocladus abbreviatus]
MAFKTSILFLALLAIALAISSEVTARDLAEKSHSEENVGGAHVEDVKYYGGGGSPYGAGHGGHGGHYGGYCQHGCCGHSHYHSGCRCCTYPGEAADAEIENKP